MIHNDGAGAAPASLGHIAVPAGINANLNIEAAGPLDPSSKISLMLHYETNGNTTYDFGPNLTDVDTPTIAGDTAVTAECPCNRCLSQPQAKSANSALRISGARFLLSGWQRGRHCDLDRISA